MSLRIRPLRLIAVGCALVALAAGAAVLVPGSAAAPPTGLFFSEYAEGSGSSKALELYNGTGSAVTLTGVYSVQLFANGSPTATATIPLTGAVPTGGVFVLARRTSSAAVLAAADQTTTSFLFSGNDAVALVKNGTPVDVIGQIGADPGLEWGTGDASTADNTIRRKPSISAGDANGADAFDPSAEWLGFPLDTFDGLGAHTVDGGGGGGGGTGTAPSAADDAITTEEDAGPQSIAVLANDADPDGDGLELQSTTDPEHGTAAVSKDTVVYLADADFNGTDSFEYTVADGNGNGDTASVTVTVTPANDDPDAEGDSASVAEDETVTVTVAANDEDADGDELTVGDVEDAEHGTASISADGKAIMYVPAPDYNGSDSFGYEIADGHGGSDEGEVIVAITAVNDPPIAEADTAASVGGAPVVVDVLANDSVGPGDEAGQTLSASSVSVPAHGQAEVVGSGPDAGKVKYVPTTGYAGPDAFTYVVSDGSATATGTVSITVTAASAKPPCSLTPTIVGTRGDDVITGTNGDDVIFARRGNDTIDGQGGNDVVCGGPGSDEITAGDGNDRVAGGTGTDTIDAGDGDDRVRGGFGADSILGRDGDEIVVAGQGDDTVDAGEGRNSVSGGPGDDHLTSGSGDDRLDGGPGADVCDADAGHNTVAHCE
jgi:Ca2+-binding RTX toxin-like protein